MTKRIKKTGFKSMNSKTKIKANKKMTPRELSLQPTMNSWHDMSARRLATLSFSLEMHKEGLNGPRRTACKSDSNYAKRLFASIGRFYVEGDPRQPGDENLIAIPTNTVFRVFESRQETSDVLVTLVLPSADQPFPDPFLANNVWRCTWEPYSSQRFKQDIQAMGDASDVLLSLRPVTFRYKPDFDPEGSPQFGLVAEEVEKVNPDLVGRDAEGKASTVRYQAVTAMLLNEFLKQHCTVRELESAGAKREATILRQQEDIEILTAGLQKQAAQIPRVSAHLEATEPAPQLIGNNQ
jgi:hypothetical protein